MKIILLFIATFLFAASALAQEDFNKTITRTGVQDTNFYFSVGNGFSLNCAYDVVYFSNESGFGKGAYSTLLSAKAQNKPISRIVYSQDTSSTICTLELIEYL